MQRWILGLVTLAVVTAGCAVAPFDDPGLGELGLTSIVYAADGSVLAEWHAEEDRVLVTYDELPRHLIDAVVAVEDERFWQHVGVDLRAIARALVANLEADDISQGGSTITQQYIKNVVLTPEVTLDRKVEEATIAVRLEESLTKEEILERYLNTVYFGDGAYGVGSAASHFFGKTVADVTVAEAALLAGLIQSPSRTDPHRNPDAAIERRRVVLGKMVELGWLDREAAESADREPLTLVPERPPEQSRFPYFTEEVKQRLLDDPALGATATDRYNAIFRGGLRIHTTLDPMAQQAAEDAVAAVMPEDGPAAALVSVEPATGYVRALVGGADFYDPDDPVARFNLATQGSRQPGSSFKPFVLAAALEQGYTLTDQFDAGINRIIVPTASGPWTVDNYGGSAFWDGMSLLDATTYSVNVVYAELVHRIGPLAVAQLAGSAGVSADLQPFYAIALGAQEVSVLDMASGYATFANDGVHIEPIFVTSIETAEGINIWSPVPIVTEAMDRNTALAVTAALTEVVDRGTGVRAQIARPVAGKTGTSQAHRDAWFVGYTPELATAVWVGFPEGAVSMEPPTTAFNVTGGSWPAEIWGQFSTVALQNSFSLFQTPDVAGTIVLEIDTSTGFLAGPLCPREHIQRVQVDASAAPTVICPVHNPDVVVAAQSITTPDVIGATLEAATSELQAAGFGQVIVEWVNAGQLLPGTVFNQSPSPGFLAQRNAPITVSVAGPRPGTEIPNVLGFPLDQARAELERQAIGLTVVIAAEANPDDAIRRAGVVWKQDPSPGEDPSNGVTLWVNP